MQVIGIDIGFGFTKATNGKETMTFKSVYGDAAEIQFKENLLDRARREDNLHIEVDGNAHFVGDLAERQSTVRYFTLDQNQLVGNFAKILCLAAMSRMVEPNDPVKLITGLPIKFFKGHKDQLAQLLTGRHSIATTSPEGERVEMVINVVQVKVIPQPFGSMFNLMLNDAGEGGDRRFLQEKVGVIDIGFRTADYTIANRTKYLERGSRTTDSGISQAFAILANKLQESSGVSIELYRLFEAVDKGSIKIRGKTYDLAKSKERVFNQLATDIANEVNRLWADEWDIDSIVISGGGGAVLAPFLKPQLEGNVLALDPAADARLNNVRGYFKYANFLWSKGAK